MQKATEKKKTAVSKENTTKEPVKDKKPVGTAFGLKEWRAQTRAGLHATREENKKQLEIIEAKIKEHRRAIIELRDKKAQFRGKKVKIDLSMAKYFEYISYCQKQAKEKGLDFVFPKQPRR